MQYEITMVSDHMRNFRQMQQNYNATLRSVRKPFFHLVTYWGDTNNSMEINELLRYSLKLKAKIKPLRNHISEIIFFNIFFGHKFLLSLFFLGTKKPKQWLFRNIFGRHRKCFKKE